MSYDAIIIGAGHNGLAAGVILSQAGWKVLIVEAQSRPGGSVRTAEVTLPGFRHDLYATNLNAFAGSAFVQEFGDGLARHGLEFLRASQAFCSIFPDGDLVGIMTSREDTLAGLARLSARDACRWDELYRQYLKVGPLISALLREPMPSWSGLRAAIRCPLGAARLMVESSGGFVRRNFENPKIQTMWAVWGMHLDFAPEIAGGALYPFLQCMLVQEAGLQIARGGAQAMVDALAALFREHGGELRCDSPVEDVVVENGVVTGVVVGGERLSARRAVVANVTPPALFGRLVKDAPHTLKRRAGGFRFGPGTMMIHLALSALPDWRNERAREHFYVHVTPSLDAMTRAYREAGRGELPDEPVLIVAQPTILDPSRAPPNRHVVSIQVRVVPSAIDWDRVKERYADRLIALLERYAPGLRALILGRQVLSPADLERANPNLAGGDNLAGSHHLSQQFMFRPFLGWSRYRTPIPQLYLCGASTWPGAGVGAGSGWILGRMLAGRG